MGIILESTPIALFCLVTEAKGQNLSVIPGFYSTNGAVDHTAAIISAPFVAMKCESFSTATSTRELLGL